jgi:hypothetical protein
VFDESQFIKAD